MRRIRHLGLAAVTALGLLAVVGAAAASAASKFEAPAYPVSLEGKAAGGTHTWGFESGGAYACTAPTLTGTLSGASSELTLTPADTTCTGLGTLKMNSCKFILHPGPIELAGTVDGTFDIGGASCTGITYTVSSCTVRIDPQAGLKATFRNEGSGATAVVVVKAEAKKVQYTRLNEACAGGKGTGNDGYYTGGWQVKGSLGGKQAGWSLSPEMKIIGEQAGMFIGGKSPQFEAEKYPLLASGEQGTPNEPIFTTFEGEETVCGKAVFQAKLLGAATTLPVEAEYKECKSSGFPALVNMNSCRYVFGVSAGPPYAGTADVSCTKAGDAIEIKTYSSDKFTFLLCTTKIGAQKGLEGVAYTNVGEGSKRGIAADVGATGLKYAVNGLCTFSVEKTGEDGAFSGSTTLHGLH